MTRKATLRIAHSRSCANAKQTSIDSLTGCTCKNGKRSYYVMWRDANGKTRKSARVHDKDTADQLQREQQVKLDKGNVGYEELKQIAFPDWAAEFEKILAEHVRRSGAARAEGQGDAHAVPHGGGREVL
jgi:hypothetical protein